MIHTIIHGLIENGFCFIHKTLGITYIDETSRYDIRSCKYLSGSVFECHDDNNNSVFCQTLTIPKNDISDISDTKSVYHYIANRHMSGHFCTIVFSSHPIPGNEKSVTGVINELMRKGADVIFEDVHVSGHACKEDIKLIYSLVNPLYAIPVHGEYKHLIAQAKIAEELGYDSDHIKILSSGDVLEIDENGAEVTGIAYSGLDRKSVV